MLRVTKKLTLAVEAVLDIACNGDGAPVQSMDIAERLGLPKRYLEQVMQQLVRAGILRGVRGPRGGYRLAREARRISVGDVFRTVGGPEDADAPATSASLVGREVLVPFWTSIEADLMRRLDAMSIDELGRRAAERADERNAEAAD